MNILWNPERNREPGESLVHYLWTCKDRDFNPRSWRPIGFAMMCLGTVYIATAIRELIW